ncbi:hypothetical protein A7985_21900 [Pseudoalteromonas luteoviolacea]|uniref:Uncharacterized protein n=1 Tax=Pseudoalteromonas luteoviolacea TaxID=43657 RepID=A0A1C0TKL8_9GAMM|nr:hypothetical protein [Pseudoalteromonas luteoviolacea]OCQ19101.1 hypothetical protein A7985_21900 [Pseudoalteromonas luteoviolacea]
MSRAKRRIRWRRVRILKPYNYYFHVGVKPQSSQLASQPQQVTQANKAAGMQPSTPQIDVLPVEHSRTVDAQQQTGHVEQSFELAPEEQSVAAEEAPVAVFEPGQNPYIFYLQQVPIMLTGLPQEVALPVPADIQVVSECDQSETNEGKNGTTSATESTLIETAPQVSERPPRQYNLRDIKREARTLLFWQNPDMALIRQSTQRQGVKSPHAADLPVRFGGHTSRSAQQRGFMAALDKHLQKRSLKLITWATFWHSPQALASWLTQLPLAHVYRILKSRHEASLSAITLEQFMVACLCHGPDGLINEAQLAHCVLPTMDVVNQFQFEGDPNELLEVLSARYSTSYWVLIRQQATPVLCERQSSLMMSAPWSTSGHIDNRLDWRLPAEVTLFTIPLNACSALEAHYVQMKNRWQPYLNMSLLEFMFSQQSLPDFPNSSDDILHRIDAST